MNDLAEQIADAVLEKLDSAPPELWQIEDVANYLNLSLGHVRDRVVKSPKFPRPVEIPGAGNKPELRWRKNDIAKWAVP